MVQISITGLIGVFKSKYPEYLNREFVTYFRCRFEGWSTALHRCYKRNRRNLKLNIGHGKLFLWSRFDLPLNIVVGSSGESSFGWIPTDISFLDLLKPDDWTRWNLDGNVRAILAEHVFEHLHPAEGLRAATQCLRSLRRGGHLRLAVPDGLFPDPDYISSVRPGGTGSGACDHKVLYDYHSLKQLLAEAGFSVTLLEWWDEKGNFHHRSWDPCDGLVRRSKKYDARNKDGYLRYTSLIADAHKP